MEKKKYFPAIYFGWWINLVTGLLSGLSAIFAQQGFSVFFKPLAADLGLSRAATSVAFSLARLEGGVQAPVTGWLSDRFGPRYVVLAGSVLMGTGLVLMHFIQSLWAFYIVWGLIIATGHNLGFTIAVDKVLTNWFISKRGMAFGLRFAMISIIGVLLLPVISRMVMTFGWRVTCLLWGIMTLAGTPLSFYFIKQHRPEYYGLMPDGGSSDSIIGSSTEEMLARGVEYAETFHETEFTLKEAMKTSSYWMLTLVWTIFGIVIGGVNVHCIPLLTDMGIAPGTAAGMMAMMVFFNIPSRFIGGFFSDRFGKHHLKYLLAGAFLMVTLGIGAFLMGQGLFSVYVFLIFVGFGTGAMTPLGITIRGRFFGRKAYGAIQGTSQLFGSPIAILSPIYAGWIHDSTGSYFSAFIIFTIMAALGVIVAMMIREP